MTLDERAITRDSRPLIAHLVYRFAVGGLENGLVNLLNRLPQGSYRHVVIALTEITEFRNRVRNDSVSYVGLGKGPGHGWSMYPRLYRLFRELRPAVLHSRNLAALEATIPAWAAGVPVRVHGEHGYTQEPNGPAWRPVWIRRAYSPFVTRYVALSQDIENYLTGAVRIAGSRIQRICNGVDTEVFFPAGRRIPIPGSPFNDPDLRVVGAVGRLQPIKDQVTLARAFCRAIQLWPAAAERLRLVLVGDGPLREPILEVLRTHGAEGLAWLAGERNDVADMLHGMDCFVLPSRGEGISNTLLEAMACGLPVIATRVGGNAELVDEGTSGELTVAMDVDAMAHSILKYLRDPELARRHGVAGRSRVMANFSISGMVESYHRLYQGLLAGYEAQPPITAGPVERAD
jgi:sugar transferase (PEP-CTERM/EpsH1 system associated)